MRQPPQQFKIQNSKFKIAAAAATIQNSKFKIPNCGSRRNNSKLKIKNSKLKKRGEKEFFHSPLFELFHINLSVVDIHALLRTVDAATLKVIEGVVGRLGGFIAVVGLDAVDACRDIEAHSNIVISKVGGL